MVGELVNTYRGRGNGWSGNRYHFSPGREIGNRGIGGRSNLDRGINTAPTITLNTVMLSVVMLSVVYAECCGA